MIELADLLVALAPAGARLSGPPAATRFERFAYDTRKLRPGELFLAVRTPRADGHDFIADAVRRGAAGIIGDRLGPDVVPSGVTAIAVDDTLLALRAWARYVLDRYAPRVVGVTGGLGKTAAAKAAVAVLGRGFAGDPGIFDGDNHNTLYGLPIALGELTSAHQVAVLELLGEEPGDLIALAELTRPSVLVVVGAFADAATNAELADVVAGLPPDGWLIVNADDARLTGQLNEVRERVRAPILRYGRGVEVDVGAVDAAYGLHETELTIAYRGKIDGTVILGALGEPGVSAALAGAAVGLALGYLPDEITPSLERVASLPGRLRPLAGLAGSLILDDTWEASPRALAAALPVLDRAFGRKIVILGELSGVNRDESPEVHRAAGHLLGPRVDRLITVGEASEPAARAAEAAGLAPGAITRTDSTTDAAAACVAGVGDVVLVIGGAEARLERVVMRLLADSSAAPGQLVRQDAGWLQRVFLSRERPTWVEVDLAAIGENVARLKALVAPAALLAVLKADAYGHGAVRVARTALLHGADYLATACLSEAIELRQHGIAAPILILGFVPPWQAPDIVRQQLTSTVYSLDAVRHLARAAHARGHGPARIHVKVDTGMGRLGLLPSDVPAFFEQLRSLDGVEVEGIFTHFACADAADPAPTRAQIARFDAVLTTIGPAGWRPRFVHAANSAGIFAFPEARYTMVRAGIAQFGLDPSANVPCPAGFRPSLTFKTLVAQVKDLPVGSPISYGGTFVTTRPSRIAVLPVGYGDGFRRSPCHWGEVLIRGQRAPIVGVVCMDMCMIDVTDVPGARAGDEVVLIGRQNREDITVADVAAQLGTISYEVITQILARVPREVPT